MTLQWLLGWWNLVFIVPFAIALTYLGVYISTGLTFGDADADADHGDLHAGDAHAETDADADADADAHHDAEGAHGADHNADGDHDHDSDHDDARSRGHVHTHVALLHLIGVGRVPVSLVLMMLLFTWGVVGFTATQALHASIASGERVALVTMPLAALASLVVTALLARVIGRVMPMNEAPAKGLTHLVGETGVAVLPIDDRFGLASVRQPGGAGIHVSCRVAPGQPPIPAHSRVEMLRFDRIQRVFYVTTPTPTETPP